MELESRGSVLNMAKTLSKIKDVLAKAQKPEENNSVAGGAGGQAAVVQDGSTVGTLPSGPAGTNHGKGIGVFTQR